MIFEQLDLYLDPVPRVGPLNMAIDEALAFSTAAPALRIYRWADAAVSFGYFGRYHDVAARWPGRALVRRWTGGGEVCHANDFTYTLVVPRSHPFAQQGPRESYCVLHAAVAELIPGANLANEDAPHGPQCFASPVTADVIGDHGKKVAGAAQRRGTFGLLHQGSIQSVSLREEFGHALAQALASTITTRSIDPALLADAEQRAADRYATETWLTRR